MSFAERVSAGQAGLKSFWTLQGEAWSRDLAVHHRELVTKNGDLDVLLVGRRTDPEEEKQLSD